MTPTKSFSARARRLALGTALFAFATIVTRASETMPDSPKAIEQELKSFSTLGSVLHIAAHPDDENRPLLAYLSLGRGYRTAYLSITRGDGGQNEIGSEFGEKLGVARTQELLAGRRIDGARQFFTRALDFGFSKSVDETLAIWDHQQVLADVVRVIRTFRPDVIITRFAPMPQRGNHGHHNSSAILALEAFKVAGDPKAFPEQIAEGLAPWQPKRIFQNGGGYGRGGAVEGNNAASLSIEAGGNDPVSGDAFTAIASLTSAMHKTQGVGGFGPGRGGGGGGARQESFTLLDGAPATKDILDGVDTTWSRFPGGAEIATLTGEAIAQFKTENPAASVPAVLAIRAKLAALPSDPVVDDKRAQLDRILQACLALRVETIVPQAEEVPGETLKLAHTVTLSANVPVRWVAVRYPTAKAEQKIGDVVAMGKSAKREFSAKLPANTPISQPYWLREEGTAGMFRVDEAKLIGRPENPPVFPVEFVFEVGGQTLVIADEPVQVVAGASEAQARRKLVAIPPVALKFPFDVALFAPGAAKSAVVEVTAARAGVAGTLRLQAPAGWKVSPAGQPFKLAGVGEKTNLTFTVTAPAQPTSASFSASAEIAGAHFDNGRVEIRYAHLPVQLLQPHTRLKAVAFDFATRGKNVGYLPGAGDSVAESLEQLGYTVKQLTGADLTPEKLRGLDAVVIGVRAFNERKDFKDNLPGLLAYVEGGGTVIAQYNRPNGLSVSQLGPFPLSIQGNAPQLRVTDETAPVAFLLPDHPALNTPNKITRADFDGWVQERGAYFPSTWDEAHYQAVLAMSDPGEEPLKSSVLVTKSGKGYYVYTGLAFFRQLPAGVPGAYRLFANLVSLGK